MIHNVLLIDKKTGEVIARARFWKIDFSEAHIKEYIAGFEDLMSTEGLSEHTPVYVEQHKVFHAVVEDDMHLIFVTDGRDEDRTIIQKIREGSARVATALRGNSIGYIRDNLEDILGDLIFTRFKVSFVGSGGVGKSTLLRLLFGKEPAPGGYVPTINVAVDSSETIQFGTFLVTIWDFAGQAVFQDLWGFYFSGTDVIFLITDSSFRNVMQTKTLLRSIRKEAPAVPLFIIANKQDLPESMRAEKIQRLLGAPTFPMVATDKGRRDEFIRLMLDVAAKTVGVQLPDRPLSEMITVHRKTEEVDSALGAQRANGKRAPPKGDGRMEDVPYSPDDDFPISTRPESDSAADGQEPDAVMTTDLQAEEIQDSLDQDSKILHTMLIVQNKGMMEVCFQLDYAPGSVDGNSVASLISALDSFGGIDGNPDGVAKPTDDLETIEHEGNLVIVEKSSHFVLGVTVTDDSQEEEQRKTMASLLIELEHEYQDVWETWDGNLDQFEPAVFRVLEQIPLRPVSLDYIVRAREIGRPIPFNNRAVGRSVVEVKDAVDGHTTVGGLSRSLDLPRENVIGALQIMEKYGWIDFQVEIGPKSVLRKIRNVDQETAKAYGMAVIKFVEHCDGVEVMEDIVKKVGVSFTPMKFVATKLVLSGVLEVVA